MSERTQQDRTKRNRLGAQVLTGIVVAALGGVIVLLVEYVVLPKVLGKGGAVVQQRNLGERRRGVRRG